MIGYHYKVQFNLCITDTLGEGQGGCPILKLISRGGICPFLEVYERGGCYIRE